MEIMQASVSLAQRSFVPSLISISRESRTLHPPNRAPSLINLLSCLVVESLGGVAARSGKDLRDYAWGFEVSLWRVGYMRRWWVAPGIER